MNRKFESIVPYNHNKRNYWFLLTFSLLSIFLHFVPSNPEFHNMLYSANVVSLIGFTIMLWISPYGFYNTYVETFKHIAMNLGISRVFTDKWLDVVVFNSVAWFIHIVPVVAFSQTYTLGNPVFLMATYLILFGAYLPKIYPYTISTTVMIGIVGLVLVYFFKNSGVYIDTFINHASLHLLSFTPLKI